MKSMSEDSPRVRLIASDAAEEFRRWEPPSMPGSRGHERQAPALTPEQIDDIKRQAHEKAYRAGFEEGRRAGLEAGTEEVRNRVMRLEQLAATLDHPLEQLDEEVEEQLVALAVTLTRHLVRRELKTDPGQIVAVVREAVNVLPASARQLRLIVHPDDEQLLRQNLALGESTPSWQIIEDPTLTRGGCRVVTESSRVDASVETRLAAIIARVLGGERVEDDGAG